MALLYRVALGVVMSLLSFVVISRTQISLLYPLYGASFLLYYLVSKGEWRFKDLVLYAALLRLLFLVHIPFLSDDFYRFIWDASLLAEGYNPFEFLPTELKDDLSFSLKSSVLDEMNSPNYYSIYPPFNQFLFYLSFIFTPHTMLWKAIGLRVMIWLAEIAFVFFTCQIFRPSEKAKRILILFLLNPLVILEFTGNLHFEVWLIALLLMSYWLFKIKGKYFLSAVVFGLAISTKLVPLMFLPLIWKQLGWKQGLKFITTSMLVFIITFTPFLSLEVVQNVLSSVDLFFRTFEFNASFYYFLRWIGMEWLGYNPIATLGLSLKVVTFSLIVYLSLNRGSLLKKAFLIYLVFILLATTVHPWYILPLFFIGTILQERSTWLWTATIFLSYVAYQGEVVSENLWLLILEYGSLFFMLLVERHKILPFNK